MKLVDGKKMSQDEINIRYVQACNQCDLEKVVKYVGLGADVNATDALRYTRALMYALNQCSKHDDTAELIVRYIVTNGAEINFKHGDKGSLMASRPYFIYHAVTNYQCSDELVYFLIQKGGTSNLDYVPTAGEQKYNSALDEIIKTRPELYKKLLKDKIVSKKNMR